MVAKPRAMRDALLEQIHRAMASDPTIFLFRLISVRQFLIAFAPIIPRGSSTLVSPSKI